MVKLFIVLNEPTRSQTEAHTWCQLVCGLDTHQWTELHHHQVGRDLSALGQTLQQSMVLEAPGELKLNC